MTARQPLLEQEYKRLLVKGLKSKFAPLAAERRITRHHNFLPKYPLAVFMKLVWPILEPASKLAWGWYLDAICEHLEAVTSGQIRNLIINIPPRFAKSTSVAVAWPCWHWTHKPETRFLFASYGADLSERDSLKCRRLIRSPWYQENFGPGNPGTRGDPGDPPGERFHILKDKDTVQKFENNYGGYRIATSVGGVTTGEGADIVVVDDPLKAQEGESKAARDAANTWYTEVIPSRINDLSTGAKVIIMQRLHEEDLTGHVLAAEMGYEHLCMPMEYEVPRTAPSPMHPHGIVLPKRKTALGWEDPRTQEGELLCPPRADEAAVVQLKRETTPYAWAGQYQQRPAPRGGGKFKRAWFEIVPPESVPRQAIRMRGWDKAATAGGGAYTAGVRWAWVRKQLEGGATQNIFYIEDVIRGQWSTEQREQVVRQTAMVDGRSVPIAMEREPGSSGIDSAQATINSLPGFVVKGIRTTGSKDVRADPMQVQAATGAIKLVRGDWNNSFLQEAETFPMGKYRDQIDAASVGFNELTKLTGHTGVPIVGMPRRQFVPR